MSKDKKNHTHLGVKSFIPAAALGSLGFVASKANEQVHTITNKLENWDKSLAPLRESTKNRNITFTEADEIFKRYVRGGHEVARSSFLGAPAAGYLQKYYEGEGLKDRSLRNVLQIPDHKFIERQHTINHYKLFKNPQTTPAEFKAHMIEKALGDPSMGNFGQTLHESTYKILKDTKTYPTFEEQHEAIKKFAPIEAETFRTAILGNEQGIGEARRLAGNTRDVLSTPEVYKIHLQPKINAVTHILPKIRKSSYIGAGILGGGLILSQYLKKTAASKKRKDAVQRTLGTAGVVAGMPLLTIGASKVISPPKGIAITYGTMPIIGMGHKTPGEAIHTLIKEDTRFKNTDIDVLERNTHSIFRGSPKQYALGINTGLGGIGADWADHQGLKRTHGMASPTMSAQKILRYQTDLLEDNGGGSGSTLQGRGGHVIAYGENVKDKLRRRGFKPHVVSDRYTPALDPNAVKEILSHDDKPIFEKLIQHQKNNAVMAPLHSAETVAQLEKHQNKKYISVYGASRGDYVGIRAKELANALEKEGLHNKYTVVAHLARGRGGVQEELVKHPNIISIGELPRKLTTELQGKAVINWGNTGASSVGENMLLKNVQAYPSKWGFDYTSQEPHPGSIAHRQDIALGKRGDHVAIDEWNKGQMSFLKKQKGVITANTAEDVVNVLKDEKQLTHLTAQATVRAVESFKEHTEAAKKLVDVVHSEYKSALNLGRLKGTIPLLAGGVAAGLGFNELHKSYKNKELKNLHLF